MGFYGNIGNINKSSFVFDKRYPSRTVMNAEASTDNVYVGRYVLVDYDLEYDVSPWRGVPELFLTNLGKTVGPDGEVIWNPIDNEVCLCITKERTDSTIIRIGTKTPDGTVIKEGVTLAVLPANGKLDPEHPDMQEKHNFCRDVDNVHSLVNAAGEALTYKDLDSSENHYLKCTGEIEDEKFGLIAKFEVMDSLNPDNPSASYVKNYKDDRTNFPDAGRGYDSTVWQKVYENNRQKYVMIAELNSVVPTFDIEADAPTDTPIMPHFDVNSTNVYYKLHWQPQWGSRVRGAERYKTEYFDKYGNIESLGQRGDISKGGSKYLSDDRTDWLRKEFDSINNRELNYRYIIPRNSETGVPEEENGGWKKVNESFINEHFIDELGIDENASTIINETIMVVLKTKESFKLENIKNLDIENLDLEAAVILQYKNDINEFNGKYRGLYYGYWESGAISTWYPVIGPKAAVYYNKDGFNPNIINTSDMAVKKENIKFLEDRIDYSSTGMSGHAYNVHKDGIIKSTRDNPDTKELSVMLPSIGDTLSEVWDKVYGGVEVNTGYKYSDYEWDDNAKKWVAPDGSKIDSFKRNKAIKWGDTTGLRLVETDPNGSGFIYSPQKAETIAGAINSANDAIGAIIETIDFEPVKGSDKLNNLDYKHIYYSTVTGQFYILVADFSGESNYTKLTIENGYLRIEEATDVTEDNFVLNKYFIYVGEDTEEARAKDENYIPATEFISSETYYLKCLTDDAEKRFISTLDEAPEGFSLINFEPNTYYYESGGDYYVSNDDTLDDRQKYGTFKKDPTVISNLADSYKPDLHWLRKPDTITTPEGPKYTKYIKERSAFPSSEQGDVHQDIIDVFKGTAIRGDETAQEFYQPDKYSKIDVKYIYDGKTEEDTEKEKHRAKITKSTFAAKHMFTESGDSNNPWKLEEEFNAAIAEAGGYYSFTYTLLADSDWEGRGAPEPTPLFDVVYGERYDPESGHFIPVIESETPIPYSNIAVFSLNKYYVKYVYHKVTDDENYDEHKQYFIKDKTTKLYSHVEFENEEEFNTRRINEEFYSYDIDDSSSLPGDGDYDYKKRIINNEDEWRRKINENHVYYILNDSTREYVKAQPEYDASATYYEKVLNPLKDDSDYVLAINRPVYNKEKDCYTYNGQKCHRFYSLLFADTEDISTYYESDKYYYKDGLNNYIRDKKIDYDHTQHYIINKDEHFEELENIKFYRADTYYYYNTITEQYVKDTNPTMSQEGDKYFLEKQYYVFSDSAGIITDTPGAIWNLGLGYIPCSITLCYKNAVMYPEPKLLEGFSRDLNTLNGLILKTNQMLDYDNPLTRDTETVQGCINYLNDIFNKFYSLQAGDVPVIDSYGRIHGADQTTKQEFKFKNLGRSTDDYHLDSNKEDEYIYWNINENIVDKNSEPVVSIKHTEAHEFEDPYDKYRETTANKNNDTFAHGDGLNSIQDVENFYDVIKLNTPIVDNMGHIVGQNTEVVTLPYDYKTITTNGRLDLTTADGNTEALDKQVKIVAKNTQDTLGINSGDGWVRLTTNPKTNTLTISHDVKTTSTQTGVNSLSDETKPATLDVTTYNFDETNHFTSRKIITYTLPNSYGKFNGDNGSSEANCSHDTFAINGDNNWIKTTVSNDTIGIAHIGPVTTTHTNVDSVTPAFGATFTIKDLDFDSKGHKANEGTHTVKIPQGSLTETTAKNNSNLLTDISFVPSTGAITVNRTDLLNLKLTNFQLGTDKSDITFNDTLGTALGKIQVQLNNLDNAHHFRGIVTNLSDITDPADGDIAMVGVKEYVYYNSSWHEFGDETIYATKVELSSEIQERSNIDANFETRISSLESKVGSENVSTQISTAITNANLGQYLKSADAATLYQPVGSYVTTNIYTAKIQELEATIADLDERLRALETIEPTE